MENIELLTVAELSKVMKVKEDTIKTWVRRKQIPQSVIFKLDNTKKGTIRFIAEKVKLWLMGELKTNGCL